MSKYGQGQFKPDPIPNNDYSGQNNLMQTFGGGSGILNTNKEPEKKQPPAPFRQ